MNSCLYECDVMHHRLFPKKNSFRYRIFMFSIDLEEVDTLHKKLWLFSRNAFNWFAFRDSDHVQFPFGRLKNGKTTKQNITEFLESQHIVLGEGRIMLVTNMAVWGYSFNPISFYLCYDHYDRPVCAVAEVCNTHGEMKMYVLDKTHLSNSTFQRRVTKHFYVSPFASLESSFDFIFKLPGNTLNMRVDDYEENKRFLLTSLNGKKKALTDARLLWYGVRFPFITARIMTLIFWQAFILWMKRVPFQKKNVHLHLQRDAYNYKKLKPTNA